MSETSGTLEAEFVQWVAVFAEHDDGEQLDVYAVMKLALTLKDMVDSLDAKVGFLTQEIRRMQGARS